MSPAREFVTHAGGRIGFALLGTGLGWVALLSWQGLIADPGRVLEPAFYGGVAIAVIGGLLRTRRTKWYLVLLAQLVVLIVWLQSRTTARTGLSAWLPTPQGLRTFVDAVVQGAQDVNTYSSPVSAKHGDAVEYLLVLGLLVILSIDVLGVGLRRTPWAGLPVVVALTVPVSVLRESLSVFVFGACALLFVLLLAGDESERVRTWARRSEEPESDGTTRRRPTDPTGPASLRATAMSIGVVAALSAFVFPVLVPVGEGIVGGGNGPGSGRGNGGPVNLVNPILDLHRDLTRGGDMPLVIANTTDRDRRYLRLTVLDQYDGARWKPSKRDLPAANRADGDLPDAPGQTGIDPGPTTRWALQFTDSFRSAWLAAPYPLASITTDRGDWRFDSRTLDFVRVDKDNGQQVDYQLDAYHPDFQPELLERAPTAPSRINDPMTELPPDLPSVVAATAEEVTAGAANNYERMVLLQDWFRVQGGFTYSLERDDGSTSGALERFITTERIGYCEQFAAAMAIMARTLGVPSRVVVGFLGPDRVEGTEVTYTSDSLHAWPEIYFEGAGWVRFEPTPPTRSGLPPSWTEQETVAPTQSPSANPTTAPVVPPNRRPVETPEAAKTESAQSGSQLIAEFAILAALLIAAAIPALLRRRRRTSRLRSAIGTPRDQAAAGAWIELLATAIDLRYPLRLRASIRRLADDLAEQITPSESDRDRLDSLVRAVEEARFGRTGAVDEALATALAADVQHWQRLLRARAGRGQRVLAFLLPRSVLVPRSLIASSVTSADLSAAGEIR